MATKTKDKGEFKIEVVKNEAYSNERRIYDELTGLYSREGFVLKVEERIEQEPSEECVMIYMNIRNFKVLNTLFGLEKGNEVLKGIGKILKKREKYGDISAHFHADHFSVYMRKTTWLEHPLDKTIEEIENLIVSPAYHLNMVVGVYMIKKGRQSVHEMNDKALIAMKSKHQSSNSQFHFFSESMLTKAKHREEVIAEFDSALKNDEFVLFLQPQFDKDGNFMGSEALARWNRLHSGEILPPSRFIDILEETKKIHLMDQYIWELAAKQIKSWENTPFKNVTISINISPEDFESVNVENFFLEIVKKYDIPPEKLRLELTETAIMSSPVKFEGFVNTMRENGFVVELDDFGSGYSSLNVLKSINVNTIKLDMVFVRGLKNDEKAEIVLDSVIKMIKKLGMNIIVEGVETRGQLEKIATMGDVVYQGYYFSKPLPISVFEEKYRDKFEA